MKIARSFVYGAQTRAVALSPPWLPGFPNHNKNRETWIMTMITEKAVALLLAVTLSGAAFNTFIV
ncbi:hypothetical protein [Porphyrobacter sp. YT40]|uniref:hypothetical protein n=1 Tax=Porphyrobacter sp. YT40 TaxID=2547601 RepID=UPI001144FF76|nr:hypothetical protein [Porphyrobacter sp. YT40]QDH33770.1 hypothetical protein E2E27_05135 [Porphyrobacter sp. YT40]